MTIHIVGGGLAGLAAAWRVATSPTVDERIVVYERLDRLGGKAGSLRRGFEGDDGGDRRRGLSDHGYHLFPLWYHNVIALIPASRAKNAAAPRMPNDAATKIIGTA